MRKTPASSCPAERMQTSCVAKECCAQQASGVTMTESGKGERVSWWTCFQSLKQSWVALCVWWASLVAQLVKNLPAMQKTQVWFLGPENPPWEENGRQLQHSCLGNPTDRGAWRATVHGVTKSQTRLSNKTTAKIYPDIAPRMNGQENVKLCVT